VETTLRASGDSIMAVTDTAKDRIFARMIPVPGLGLGYMHLPDRIEDDVELVIARKEPYGRVSTPEAETLNFTP
jgi:hypothetical protein